MCPTCEGLGSVEEFHIDTLIDRDKSLNEGAIQFPTFRPGDVRWKRYVDTGLFDVNKKVGEYSEDEWDTLLYRTGFKPPHPLEGWPPTSTYEGVIPRIKRTFLTKESREKGLYREAIEAVVAQKPCPVCHGGRLNEKVLGCRIQGKNIAEYTSLQASELIEVLREIKEPLAAPNGYSLDGTSKASC